VPALTPSSSSPNVQGWKWLRVPSLDVWAWLASVPEDVVQLQARFTQEIGLSSVSLTFEIHLLLLCNEFQHSETTQILVGAI